SLVAFMDADASLDPGDLLWVLAPLRTNDADLVLRARQTEAGAWPAHARVANRYLAGHVSRRHRLPARLRDLGPIRAARRDELLALGIVDRRSGWPLEMVVRAAVAGWRLAEVPVPYRR